MYSHRLLSSISGVAVSLIALAASAGVQAQNQCGPAAADGSVTCTPEGNPFANGIAYVAPTGGLTVVLQDGVNVARSTGDAVSVVAAGNARATVNGTVQATGASGNSMVVTGGDRAEVTVGPNARVTAVNGDGIVLTSVNGSTLNNAGVIGVSDSGFAVAAFGGPLTVNNTGTLTSDIRFTGGADVVNNSGTFVVGPNPDFGAGTNVFNNSGTVRFASGATTPVSRTFSGLTAFNNTGGIIDLRNGVAGDVLTLPGTLNGSGNSRVGLDADLSGTPVADRIVIGGAATGSTMLDVDILNPGTLNSGVVLVQAGAGTQAGAFTLANGARTFGLTESDIVFDPTANTFALVSAPGAGAYRTAGFVDVARNIWHKSADAVTAHLRAGRDGAWAAAGGEGSPGGGLWVQMHASTEQRGRSVDANNFGLARNFDVGSDQDYFGGQVGFDFGGGIGGDGNFAFGVTGGYINSQVGFAGVSDRLSFDVYNAGAYATVNSGNIFLNVLGKYDLYRGRTESQVGQFNEQIRGDSYGAQGEVGIRFGSDAFFVEPVGTIAYVRTNLNDLVVQGSTVEFRGDEGLRGKLGARIGASIDGIGPNAIVLYAGGNYVHEFMSNDAISFINGGQTIEIAHGPRGDYGEGLIGVNISATNMVSGFIEANGARGSEFEAYGGRAGLRIRF
jgi:trimeric autotransporter adhesin